MSGVTDLSVYPFSSGAPIPVSLTNFPLLLFITGPPFVTAYMFILTVLSAFVLTPTILSSPKRERETFREMLLYITRVFFVAVRVEHWSRIPLILYPTCCISRLLANGTRGAAKTVHACSRTTAGMWMIQDEAPSR